MLQIQIIIAFLADLALGDPRWFPHPVRVFGALVAGLEKLTYPKSRMPVYEFFAGLLLAVFVAGSVFVATSVVIVSAYKYLGGFAAGALSVLLAYTTISVKGLADAANEVLRPLEQGNLDEARKKLAMVVGRDTDGLDEQEIARAVVETVAESTSDGIVAPLFYLAIGGAPLAMAYKAVNTMDSMIGYRSDRYKYFGKAAARLDDIANLFPARLSGLLAILASWFLKAQGGRFSTLGAWRIFYRDRLCHPSPNSGNPESAFAGALQVRLGGVNSYFGVPSRKPYIGEPFEPITAGKVRDSVRLMYATSLLGLAASVILSAIKILSA
jgi:adenosylcobinamide-phosphate synthase